MDEVEQRLVFFSGDILEMNTEELLKWNPWLVISGDGIKPEFYKEQSRAKLAHHKVQFDPPDVSSNLKTYKSLFMIFYFFYFFGEGGVKTLLNV